MSRTWGGKTVWQRFRSKFHVAENGCWLWDGQKDDGGYGRFSFEGRQRERAHNVTFIVMRGTIDRAYERDHLCRTRACVNPFHLEQVTHCINSQRSDPGKYGKAKTHCPRGHAYTEENTRIYRGRRFCRECRQLHALGLTTVDYRFGLNQGVSE